MNVTYDFESDEPRRFDVVEALRAYNEVNGYLLGSEGQGRGFFDNQHEKFKIMASRAKYTRISSFFSDLSDALILARDNSSHWMDDLRRGILSADHYFSIVDSEGYGKTDGSPDNHPGRITKHLKSMILPKNQNRMVADLARVCVLTKKEVSDEITSVAEEMERIGGNGGLGYLPSFYKCASRYMVVNEKIGEMFGRLEDIIKPKKE